jgi:ankyrin repeat protein
MGRATELLLSLGANPNHRNENGCYPVHIACSQGNTRAVKSLIGAGALLDVSNNAGDLPIHTACSAPHTNADMLSLLRRGGANFNVPNKRGMYPIHLAVRSFTDEDAFAYLVSECRSTVQRADPAGNTPLQVARAIRKHFVSVLASAEAPRDLEER